MPSRFSTTPTRSASGIVQLGGTPNFQPAGLATGNHSEPHQGRNLCRLIGEDLIAERIAMETYTEMVRWMGDADPVSRRLIEQILAREETHAFDLAGLMESF